MWNINSVASSDLAHSGMLLRASRTESGSDLRSKLCYLQSSHAKYIWAEAEVWVWGHKIYLDGSDQRSLISLSKFYTQQSFFLSTSPTTWMFLVYPIRPHFLGHNFLSLNPSISDKKNIQTLRGDSALTLCWSGGPWSHLILHILSFNWNIKILSSPDAEEFYYLVQNDISAIGVWSVVPCLFCV